MHMHEYICDVAIGDPARTPDMVNLSKKLLDSTTLDLDTHLYNPVYLDLPLDHSSEPLNVFKVRHLDRDSN